MIIVFISIHVSPLHKRQTTIKPRKLLKNATVWCGERDRQIDRYFIFHNKKQNNNSNKQKYSGRLSEGTKATRKFWNFIPANATWWCILLPPVVTIICSHWPVGGMVPGSPLNTPLVLITVHQTCSSYVNIASRVYLQFLRLECLIQNVLRFSLVEFNNLGFGLKKWRLLAKYLSMIVCYLNECLMNFLYMHHQASTGSTIQCHKYIN